MNSRTALQQLARASINNTSPFDNNMVQKDKASLKTLECTPQALTGLGHANPRINDRY